MFVVKPDCGTEIVHGLLILSDGHEGVAPVSVVFGVGGAFIAGGGALEAGDSLAEFLDGDLCIFFFLFLVKFFEMLLAVSIEFVGKFLLLVLFLVVGSFFLFAFGLGWIRLHKFIM